MFAARNAFMTGSPPPPVITSFSPTSLSNGTGTVTISGNYFIPSATTVTVGGTAATSITVNANLQSLTAAFPSKGRGTYSVVVTTPGGSASANFTYTVTPSISSISPNYVYFDYGSGYTIYGSRFSSSGATSVYVSNGGYYGISVTNDGQLYFNPGAIGPGNFSAWVVAPDGWSNPVGFSTVYYPAPTISSVTDGRSGRGSLTGSTITVSGSNFTNGTTSVSIDGVGVSATVSATSVSFACPNLGSDGAKTITIATSASGTSASTSVQFWAARGAEITQYTSGSGSYAIPDWANAVDIVVLGGGGGGNYGLFGGVGGGGGAGSWNAGISNAPATISYGVGAGGSGGTNSSQYATNGSASTGGAVTGGGGQGGKGQGVTLDGYGAGNYTYNGVTYTGGAPTATNNNISNSSQYGNPPGGGGAGGFYTGNGGGGANGSVWFRARQ